MAQSVSQHEQASVEGIGARRYYVVWIALLVLTAVTVVVGRVHLEHGLGLLVAIVIATVKATLVALFFMHLWDHGGANRLVLVTSLFFVLLLLGLTLLDNASRFSLTNPPTRANMRQQPPGPDILSPMVGGESPARGAPSTGGAGTSTEHQGPRDQAPQERR
jgi:cytochrome c oxidase subunit 4